MDDASIVDAQFRPLQQDLMLDALYVYGTNIKDSVFGFITISRRRKAE